jgi:phenylalanyl-tRNA synthetase beta chain
VNASLLWLHDFLDVALSADEVRDILTARAATVEGVVPVRADLEEVIIGRVVHAERHPDAEKLWLTRVDAGTGELLQVVCGAPNVEVGRAYPFAPVGATLPGGVTIEKRKIRGQLSNGMLCSARELGLGADHTGILALDTPALPGTRFLSAVSVGDVRFEIDVLPNRPDLLSHEGLARELAAARGSALRRWDVPPGSNGSPAAEVPAPRRVTRDGNTDGVRVSVEDVDGCPRYIGTVIRGVRVGPSPQWLVQRLEGAGVRSINNVVDATNFMLHGFGQPMHAFDLDRLGGAVVVREARPDERIVTLDGIERTLTPGMTVIAGAERAEAIAGVIGGEGSEVAEATTDILLETAVFNPRRVRATRQALGVSTDASYRFERHVDEEQVAVRAVLAARLITALAGGRVIEPGVDVHPTPAVRRAVHIRPARAELVLGERIGADEAAALLRTVGFDVSGGSERLQAEVPGWRNDVTVEIDLIEEVARLRGYDSFASEVRPFRPTTVPDDPMVAVERRVREALVGYGLFETRPMPFSSRASDERLRLRNPLAENEAYLRRSLLESLAHRAEHNLAHMARSVRLFEVGTVFQAGTGARPREQTHVAALVMGHAEPPHFTNAQPRAFDPWDIKWIAEVIAKAAFGATDIMFHISESGSTMAGGDRELWKVEAAGRSIGRVALVALDAPVWASPAYGFEIDLSGAADVEKSEREYVPLPATPPAEIDIALIVPDDVSASRVEEAILRHGGEILESAMLFDEFRGAGVEPGARSLAWRLTFRHPDRTLRDREVEARKDKLLTELRSELGVRPRTG